MAEIIALHGGQILAGVHEAGTCYMEHCCIHNPSEHPLRTAPLDWMQEIRAMSRVCEHGYRHPDPDDLDFKMAIGDRITVEAITSVHLVRENCDGCCYVPESVDVGTESTSGVGTPGVE